MLRGALEGYYCTDMDRNHRRRLAVILVVLLGVEVVLTVKEGHEERSLAVAEVEVLMV